MSHPRFHRTRMEIQIRCQHSGGTIFLRTTNSPVSGHRQGLVSANLKCPPFREFTVLEMLINENVLSDGLRNIVFID